jgi:hypothetical protein
MPSKSGKFREQGFEATITDPDGKLVDETEDEPAALASTLDEAIVRHRARIHRRGTMGLILLLVVLVLLFGGGGFYMGAPYHYYGGGLGTILIIVIVVLLLRG